LQIASGGLVRRGVTGGAGNRQKFFGSFFKKELLALLPSEPTGRETPNAITLSPGAFPTMTSSLTWPASVHLGCTIPPADAGHHLIANITLLSISCIFFDIDHARRLLLEATKIARRLKQYASVYRPATPHRAVQLSFSGPTGTQCVLMSFMGDVLILPQLDLGALPSRLHGSAHDSAIADLTQLEIAYFALRLRTTKLATMLEHAAHVTTVQDMSFVSHKILQDCLYHNIAPTNPLDRAIDYFTLATNFVRLGNLPLANLALHQADAALLSSGKGCNKDSIILSIRILHEKIQAVCNALTRNTV